MAAKKSKAKKSSITKKAAATSRRQQQWPWSELPPANSSIHPHILQTYRGRIHLNSAPAVTKSWLPPTTRCEAGARQWPQLRLVATAATKNPIPHRPHGTHFLDDSSCIADAVHQLPDASHWCYLKSDTKPESHPPPTIPSNGPQLFLKGVLCPNAPSSGLMVNYTVCRYITPTSRWLRDISIRHECTTADPFEGKKKFMEFTSVVECRGKFYATSLQGALVVMRAVDNRLKITAVSATRVVPSVSWRFFKKYLFEMKGEIMLVFLIHQKSLAVVDHVEVFRLDLDNLGWVKVERLLGKTMFLNEGCFWLYSAEFGCRDDRVYFTQGLEKSWRVYDLKTCCISPVLFGWS